MQNPFESLNHEERERRGQGVGIATLVVIVAFWAAFLFLGGPAKVIIGAVLFCFAWAGLAGAASLWRFMIQERSGRLWIWWLVVLASCGISCLGLMILTAEGGLAKPSEPKTTWERWWGTSEDRNRVWLLFLFLFELGSLVALGCLLVLGKWPNWGKALKAFFDLLPYDEKKTVGEVRQAHELREIEIRAKKIPVVKEEESLRKKVKEQNQEPQRGRTLSPEEALTEAITTLEAGGKKRVALGEDPAVVRRDVEQGKQAAFARYRRASGA